MSAPHRESPPLSQVLRDPRLALMLALGFSSGLPFLLIFSTQSVWLREAGVSRSAIGLMSYAALAFAFKFAWAPIIDRFDPPGFGPLLGRRRGWMLTAQIGVALGLAGLAFGDPAQTLTWNVAFAFLTAFAAATQDATIDGWRIDAAPAERQGMMAAIYQLGYRLAMLCAGAGALYIADFVSWRAAYLAMAALMVVGIGGCLLSPRLDSPPRETTARFAAFGEPLADLVRRYGATLVVILALVAIYRLPDFVMGPMYNPYYHALGLTKDTVAAVRGTVGLVGAILGIAAGGMSTVRLGLFPTLVIGAVLQGLGVAAFGALAYIGGDPGVFGAVMAGDNFAQGYAGVALVAYMSSLTGLGYTATQYALLSSTYALLGKFLKGFSGVVVEGLTPSHGLLGAYATAFIGAGLITVPALVLFIILARLNARALAAPAQVAPS